METESRQLLDQFTVHIKANRHVGGFSGAISGTGFKMVNGRDPVHGMTSLIVGPHSVLAPTGIGTLAYDFSLVRAGRWITTTIAGDNPNPHFLLHLPPRDVAITALPIGDMFGPPASQPTILRPEVIVPEGSKVGIKSYVAGEQGVDAHYSDGTVSHVRDDQGRLFSYSIRLEKPAVDFRGAPVAFIDQLDMRSKICAMVVSPPHEDETSTELLAVPVSYILSGMNMYFKRGS